MALKLSLSSKELLDKIFPVAPRGYDALAVDSFLDQIMRDYQMVEANSLLYKSEKEDMEKQLSNLIKKNQELEIEIEKYRNRLQGIKESDNVTKDNMALLQKINKLETFLWNHGFNPATIK